MKKADMAFTKAERKKSLEPMPVGSKDSGPQYPYGLRLNLDQTALEKLSVKKLPRVGATMSVEATAKVVSVSSNERSNGSKDRNVELQIERMALGSGSASSMEEAVEEGVKAAS